MPFPHSIWSPKGIKICEVMHLNRVTQRRWTINRNRSIQAAKVRRTSPRLTSYRPTACLLALWLCCYSPTIAAAFTSVTVAGTCSPSCSRSGSVVVQNVSSFGWSLRGQNQTQQDRCKGLWENHFCLGFVVKMIISLSFKTFKRISFFLTLQHNIIWEKSCRYAMFDLQQALF